MRDSIVGQFVDHRIGQAAGRPDHRLHHREAIGIVLDDPCPLGQRDDFSGPDEVIIRVVVGDVPSGEGQGDPLRFLARARQDGDLVERDFLVALQLDHVGDPRLFFVWIVEDIGIDDAFLVPHGNDVLGETQFVVTDEGLRMGEDLGCVAVICAQLHDLRFDPLLLEVEHVRVGGAAPCEDQLIVVAGGKHV